MFDRERAPLDRHSFILGMITAFSECVAGGCKRLALSPPLEREDYLAVAREAEELIERHGLIHYHEENLDLPEEDRFHWILIAARQGTVDEYLEKRARGLNPMRSLAPFYGLLSYRPEEGVSTGYDAWRDLFPREKS